MAVESSAGKGTKTPCSVVTKASAREGKYPGTSTPSRIPILKTRVGFVCPDTTPKLPQSSTETAQAIPGGQDTTPASTEGQCVKHGKPKRKRSRRHKTSKASSRKGDECQKCSTMVFKTDSAFECNFCKRWVSCRCNKELPKAYYEFISNNTYPWI
ncbi:unnamed protein product [Trichobilharzia regenti]|nr:unnamed protein product [Trichobilharzia regenti]